MKACVPTIAAVSPSTAAAADSALRHQLPGSTSTKRGSSPFQSTAWSVEANVNEGTSTRAPRSSPSARTASVSPTSQFDTART